MEAIRSRNRSSGAGSCSSKGHSAFRGVDKKGNKWIASTRGEVQVQLGTFEEEEEDAQAYDSAAFHLYKA